MKQHVFVVEIKGRRHWTVIDTFLKRSDATTRKYSWLQANPDDVFRVTKYVPIAGTRLTRPPTNLND